MQDNAQQQQSKISHSISAKEASNQAPYVCGGTNPQKLNRPVQQHHQTEENIQTPETADNEMPEQGEQLTYVYASTSGTDRKLIPAPIKASFG